MQTEKCQSGTGECGEDEKLGMCICYVLLLLLLLLQCVCVRRKQYECKCIKKLHLALYRPIVNTGSDSCILSLQLNKLFSVCLFISYLICIC
jgi:hypothetical protein